MCTTSTMQNECVKVLMRAVLCCDRYRVTEQKDMPWVAVDPETSLLWSCQWVRLHVPCILYLDAPV